MKLTATTKKPTGAAPGGETPVDPGVKPIPVPPMVREVAAPRQWNRRGVAGAVLLVLLGGLLVMLALPAYAQRTDVLVVARPVKAGQLLADADLAVAKVSAGSDVVTIPQASRATVVGKAATTALEKGSLLSPSLVTTQLGFTGTQVLVGLPVKVGQMPAGGVVAGQKVQVVGTPGTAAGQSSPWANATIPAVVMAVSGRDAASGVTVVDVRLDSGNGAQAARLASTGNFAVLALPVGS